MARIIKIKLHLDLKNKNIKNFKQYKMYDVTFTEQNMK